MIFTVRPSTHLSCASNFEMYGMRLCNTSTLFLVCRYLLFVSPPLFKVHYIPTCRLPYLVASKCKIALLNLAK